MKTLLFGFVLFMAFGLAAFAHAQSDALFIDAAGSVGVSAKASVGNTIVLDGSKNASASGAARVSWRQVSGPSVEISNAASIKASVTPRTAGTYVFELMVTDPYGTTRAVQSVSISVGSNTGITPVILEVEPIKGESTDDEEAKKGTVEYGWKAEEGKSPEGEGIEPDEIDAKSSAALRGGVSVAAGDVNGLTDEERATFLAQVKAHAQVQSGQDLENFAKGILLQDEGVEAIDVEDDKIVIAHKAQGLFLGLIRISFTERVEVGTSGDGAGKVKVRLPWFSFLVSEDVSAADIESEVVKKIDALKWEAKLPQFAEVISIVSNVLKTKHDTVKNSINNVR